MSILRPRTPHPPPTVPMPAVARVQPMVPEVSLFVQPRPPIPDDNILGRQSPPPRRNSPPQPPPPAELPPQHLLLPQSDFSRIFHTSGATIFLNGSDAASYEVHERHVQINSTSADSVRAVVSSNNSQTQELIRFHHQVKPSFQSAPVTTTTGQISYPYLPSSRPSVLPSNIPLNTSSVHSHKLISTFPSDLPAARNFPSTLPPDPPSIDSTNTPPPNLTTSNGLPPDLVKVLSWQSDHLAWQNSQLAKLQEQVATLLAASPVNNTTTPVKDAGSSPMLKRNSYTKGTPTANAGTNTSTVWTDIQAAMNKLRYQDETGDNNPNTICLEDLKTVQVSRDSTASPQPSVHIDLPAYEDSPSMERTTTGGPTPRRPSMTSWSSPVLGESVSMYEEQENNNQMCENILGQVRRLLAQDPPGTSDEQSNVPQKVDNLHQPGHDDVQPVRGEYIAPHTAQNAYHNPPALPQTEHPAHHVHIPTDQPSPPDPTAATLERLREMGVSFISPTDLSPGRGQDKDAPYNSVYLPQVRLPSSSILVGASTDTSLDINTLALKYLDDKQLGKLAVRHNNKKVSWEVEEKAAPDYSIATNQFLARHGIGGGQAAKVPESSPRTGLAVHSEPVLGGLKQPENSFRNAVNNRQTYNKPESIKPVIPQPVFPSHQAVKTFQQPTGNQRFLANTTQPNNLHQVLPVTGEHFQFPASHDRVFPAPGRHPIQNNPNMIPDHVPQPPVLSNRVLDITAIRQQPKLL